jgi:cation transport regulator ChaC
MREDIWLFGYGSIMWKTGFEYETSRLALLKDHARRFWQGSEDHRGIPGAPGRVVTLIHTPGEDCWGMAYRIHADLLEEVLGTLDYREKGGYERELISIEFRDGETASGITYFATSDNPHYLGPADDHAIAQQITESHGPSGSNIEYLLQLNATLAKHSVADTHVSRLAELAADMSGR